MKDGGRVEKNGRVQDVERSARKEVAKAIIKVKHVNRGTKTGRGRGGGGERRGEAEGQR